MKKVFFALTLIHFTFASMANTLSIDLTKSGVALSPYLYGVFFEDINYGADGGLYAELVQNRSFEYYPVLRAGISSNSTSLHPLTAWDKVIDEGAKGEIYVTRSHPLNKNNRNHLEIFRTNGVGYMGVSNSGFDSICLTAGEEYDLSFYSRFDVAKGVKSKDQKIRVTLTNDAGQVIDELVVERSELVNGWSKFSKRVKANVDCESARVNVLVHGQGVFLVDMVSLYPVATFKNRQNGMRRDLAEALECMQPSFIRFPGGCIAHGWGLDNAYRWKDTVGDVAERKPNWNRWGYHQTYGLGYFEYFQLCEDLGATPLPVVPLGISCSLGATYPYEFVPMDEMQEYVDDALDLIEFAIGDKTTQWGSVRAEMGHPEPFEMEYICLGNEEGDLPQFHERIPLFVDAIRQEWPNIKIIGTSGLSPEVPLYDKMAELGVWSSDEHYYQDPEWFIENQDRFDNLPRKDMPRIFVGEYASRANTLYNALAEAAYLTGIERNGDLVEMTCYAPLFANVNHIQWRANMIFFDNRSVMLTPNYYVQQAFATNKGDEYITASKSWEDDNLAVSTTYDNETEELILKVVNTSMEDTNIDISINGGRRMKSIAECVTISGAKSAHNTIEKPFEVIPEKSVAKVGKSFSLPAKAMSLQVVRVKVAK